MKPGEIIIVDGLEAKSPESSNVGDAEMTRPAPTAVLMQFARVR